MSFTNTVSHPAHRNARHSTSTPCPLRTPCRILHTETHDILQVRHVLHEHRVASCTQKRTTFYKYAMSFTNTVSHPAHRNARHSTSTPCPSRTPCHILHTETHDILQVRHALHEHRVTSCTQKRTTFYKYAMYFTNTVSHPARRNARHSTSTYCRNRHDPLPRSSKTLVNIINSSSPARRQVTTCLTPHDEGIYI